jgi:DNA-binding NarL/FixJ family response regulator
VRESSLCVAVFDLSTSRILALSASASARLGLTGDDLSGDDYVEAATDPDAVRRLVALVSDGDVRREARRLAERVAALERHLDRIGQEVGAARNMTIVSALPRPSTVPGLAELSTRQVEVVTRLLRGQRVLTIAREMFLSPSTIRNHLSTIYRKVGVASQADLLDLLQRGREADGSAQPLDDPAM